MGYKIKQNNTTRVLVFLMVDSTDHITGKTGLTPAVTLSKNGAIFAAPAGAVTEVGNGWYRVAANATDANTLGAMALHATATGADPTDDVYEVVAYDPDAAGDLGLGNLDAKVSTRLATSGYTAPDNATIAANNSQLVNYVVPKVGYMVVTGQYIVSTVDLSHLVISVPYVSPNALVGWSIRVQDTPHGNQVTTITAASNSGGNTLVTLQTPLDSPAPVGNQAILLYPRPSIPAAPDVASIVTGVWTATGPYAGGTMGGDLSDADNRIGTVSALVSAWSISAFVNTVVDPSNLVLSIPYASATSLLGWHLKLGVTGYDYQARRVVAVSNNAGSTQVTLDTPLDGTPGTPATVYLEPVPVGADPWAVALPGSYGAGTAGALLAGAGASADPLLNAVPGAYAAGTAGFVLGEIPSIYGRVNAIDPTAVTVGPIVEPDGSFTVRHGDYYPSGSIYWTETTGKWLQYVGMLAVMTAKKGSILFPKTVTFSVVSGSTVQATLDTLMSHETEALATGTWDMDVQVNLGTDEDETPITGKMTVLKDVSPPTP